MRVPRPVRCREPRAPLDDPRALFYISLASDLMSVQLEPAVIQPSLRTRTSQALFRTRITGGGVQNMGFKQTYDVFPDGERFLTSVVPERETTIPLTVLLNPNPE